MIKILPSILTSDFTGVNKDLELFQRLGIDEIHLDVMDGNFVPAMTFGPKYISDMKKHNKELIFDTHLMITRPDKHIKDYIDAGSNSITVHIEVANIKSLLKMKALADERNVKFGLAINPETNVKKLDGILKKIDVDIILVMSVHPGAGGQKFMPEMLSKVDYLNDLKVKKGYSYSVAIDGGVNEDNFKIIKDRHVERAVIGSAIYKDMKLEENIEKFRQLDK